jgi:hypothetical protein
MMLIDDPGHLSEVAGRARGAFDADRAMREDTGIADWARRGEDWDEVVTLAWLPAYSMPVDRGTNRRNG